MDGRADLYGDDLLRMYVSVIGVEGDPQVVLDRYGIDHAVLPPDWKLAQWFDASPLWDARVRGLHGGRLGAQVSWRDLLVLFGIALLARIAAAWLVDYPPYTDPAYYLMVAQQLADGHGFTAPALWSFLEVGGRLPADPDAAGPEQRPLDAAHLDRGGGLDRRLRAAARHLARSPAAVRAAVGRAGAVHRLRGLGAVALAAGGLGGRDARPLRRAVPDPLSTGQQHRRVRRGRGGRHLVRHPSGPRAARDVVAGGIRRAGRCGHPDPRRRHPACGGPGRGVVGQAGRAFGARRRRLSGRVSAGAGAVAGARHGGVRGAVPLRRRPHPVDHQLQRAVLHQPRADPSQLLRRQGSAPWSARSWRRGASCWGASRC